MIHTKEIKFSISEYFEQDHDRLDVLFRDYMKLKNLHFAKARECFVAFKHRLERHIAWERDVLFPVFKTKTGIDEGPIAVLEEEHRQILGILERINLKIQRNDASSNRLEHDLVVILGHHDAKEENVLYPVLDYLLTAEEKADLFIKMQNIPANTCDLCCAAS
ncbi:hemerythrin domain-containing protein [bacterium]|nr:hemerythrin domain-containing protein [bacterium]